MKRKPSKGLILFVLVLIIPYLQACNAQTQEEEITAEDQLRADIQEWMTPYRNQYRREWAEEIGLSKESATSTRQHPLFKRMTEFYETNQSRYRQTRLESLHRYQSAPTELPGYESLDISGMEYDFDLIQDLSNVRTFDAGDTRAVLSMITGDVIDYIREKGEMTSQETAVKMAAGNVLFADQLGDEDNWKLTYVNRLYAVQFDWNILTNRLSNMKVMVYKGEEQKPGWLKEEHFKGNTTRLKLLSSIQAFRWSRYDQYQLLKHYSDDLEDLEGFITKHRDEYVQVRKAALCQLPEANDSWRESYQHDEELQNELLAQLGMFDEEQLPTHLSLWEIGYEEVLSMFRLCLQRREEKPSENVQVDFMLSWLVGDNVHAREVRENVWDIVGFIDDYALYYRWNIATDEVEEISCWQKTRIKKE
jgi:hypothetical protein